MIPQILWDVLLDYLLSLMSYVMPQILSDARLDYILSFFGYFTRLYYPPRHLDNGSAPAIPAIPHWTEALPWDLVLKVLQSRPKIYDSGLS